MLTSLLANDGVIEAIKREQKKKKITANKARKQAQKYANEIASSYSYKTIRVVSRLLSWLWNKMYGGLQVYNAERVRNCLSAVSQKPHRLSAVILCALL